MNVVLGIWISHVYFQRPEHVYYATNGIVPPEMLNPLDRPNESSTPLLGSEQEVFADQATVK